MRKIETRWWILILGCAGAMSLACTGPYAKEFRTAAGDSLQNGIQGILTGVVDGVFAVYETDNTNTSSTTG